MTFDSGDYLVLVDWSGRAIIDDKRGSIPEDLPPILDRLRINPDNYIRFINRTPKHRLHNVSAQSSPLLTNAVQV